MPPHGLQQQLPILLGHLRRGSTTDATVQAFHPFCLIPFEPAPHCPFTFAHNRRDLCSCSVLFCGQQHHVSAGAEPHIARHTVEFCSRLTLFFPHIWHLDGFHESLLPLSIPSFNLYLFVRSALTTFIRKEQTFNPPVQSQERNVSVSDARLLLSIAN
jgi:hypothetical protein